MMVSQNIGTPRYPPFLDGIFHSRPFGGTPMTMAFTSLGR